jgi:hypothetical protein
MKKERFNSIDGHSRVVYSEQAYAFRQIGKEQFKVSVAVVNPLSLMPSNEKRTVGGFLNNIDAICEIGRGKNTPRFYRQNEFLADYASGMRQIYKEKYLWTRKEPDYIVYAATVDFNAPHPLNESVGNFSVDLKPSLQIDKFDFNTYGIVYPLDKTELFGNVRAAQSFEASGRRNQDFQRKYKKIETDRYDTLGQFVVWGAGMVIKKAASLYGVDHSLHLITTKNYVERKNEILYRAIRDKNDDQNKPCSSPMTSPFSDPAALLNIMQTISYAEKGFPMLGPKELKKLLPELQARNDGGIRRTEAIKSQSAEIIAKVEQKMAARQEPKAQTAVLAIIDPLTLDPLAPQWKQNLYKAFAKPLTNG